jgi:hypothetical protein
VNALGLFDLQRRPRPVAAAYLELLRQFADEPLLPKQPLQVANTDLYRLRGEENVFGPGRSWSFWSSSR